METLNKCILNYRQSKSLAFTEALGNLQGQGGERHGKGLVGGKLTMGKRVQPEKGELGRRKKRRRKNI